MPFVALKKFAEQFSDENPRSISQLLLAETDRISFSFSAFEDEDYSSVLQAIKSAMPALSAVVENPRYILGNELELKRSDMVTRLSAEGIRETIRNSTLWRNDGGVYTPDFVYADTVIDDYDIYENRVVCALVDRLLRILSVLMNYSRAGIKTLYGECRQSASLSKLDLVRIVDDGLLARKENILVVYKDIFYLRKRLFLLRDTPYLRRMAKCKKFTDRKVNLTNIFDKDPNYHSCYKLWNALNNFEAAFTQLDAEERQSAYRAFVSLSLINSYVKRGFKIVSNVKVGNVTKNFTLKDFALRNELFSVYLSTQEDKIKILVQCPAVRVQQKTNVALISDTIMSADYGDSFVVSLYNTNYSDVSVYASPSNNTSLGSIESIARLTVLTFDVHDGVYDRICPICGNKELVRQKLYIFCPECKAAYLFPESGKVWINRFKCLNAASDVKKDVILDDTSDIYE